MVIQAVTPFEGGEEDCHSQHYLKRGQLLAPVLFSILVGLHTHTHTYAITQDHQRSQKNLTQILKDLNVSKDGERSDNTTKDHSIIIVTKGLKITHYNGAAQIFICSLFFEKWWCVKTPTNYTA